jgi:NAD(P)-dependent dehydrogenase (short-subunit alcohol dehydrogenase family)
MWVGQLRAIEWGRAICHDLRGRQRIMAQAQVLAGRVAVVTGAANGMARVMARALAGAGAKVAGVDVDAGGLDRLAAEPVFAGKFLNAVADVSKAANCRHAVEQVLGTFGALDILINCAGISMSTAAGHKEARIKFFEADPEGWQRIVAINAIGAFLMARFAAEPMIKRGWGRIINVTTSFDTMLAGGLSAYGASKAALEANCVSFAKDLEGTGVTVNILVPGGPTDTPGFFPPAKPRPPQLLDPEIMGTPAVWLASPQSDGISACRFIARDWDVRLPAAEAAARARAPAAWPALAERASAARGYAM